MPSKPLSSRRRVIERANQAKIYLPKKDITIPCRQSQPHTHEISGNSSDEQVLQCLARMRGGRLCCPHVFGACCQEKQQPSVATNRPNISASWCGALTFPRLVVKVLASVPTSSTLRNISPLCRTTRTDTFCFVVVESKKGVSFRFIGAATVRAEKRRAATTTTKKKSESTKEDPC